MAAPRFDDPDHLNKIRALEAQDYVPPTYPNRIHSHVLRNNLMLVKDGQGNTQGTLRNEDFCMICREEESASGSTELLSCDGQMSGEMKDGEVMGFKERPFRACNSKFHLECIMDYNADNYDFHYSARTECQNKFLCPLHCCSVCNTEHKKQSAYESRLIECAKCVRAFHVDCCSPAGSKLVEVTIEFGEEEAATFRMLTCPSHCEDAEALHHIPACCMPDCGEDGDLQECYTCMRSFHLECKEVEMLNGERAPDDQCDVCASEGVIVAGTLVIAYCPRSGPGESGGEYHMGIIGQAATQLGAVTVEWLKNGRPTCTYGIGLSHIVDAKESYFHLAPNNQKSHWEATFEKWKGIHSARHPQVFKEVFTKVRKSTYVGKQRMPQEEVDNLCKCGSYADCGEDCGNAKEDQECPPSCRKYKEKGFFCNNRKISTGFVHPNIEMRKTDKKGWGVFANAPIKEGEFLAAFHGEIICEEEYRRRNAVKKGSGDQQYVYQFMDLYNGFKLDMSTHGNISRYVNNSCDNPTAAMYTKGVYSKKKGDTLWYEKRCYLKATKSLEVDDEVTITYGDNSNGSPCFCDSCKKKMAELQ